MIGPRLKLTNEELRATPLPICGSVTVLNPGGGGDGGGLTDVQLRAAPVSVTGPFYPITQPVSIASMPSTPVTGTFWQTTQPISGTVGVSGSVAVTGAFYPATQPVSIASMPSTPVTGTFFQATQPVSIAATVAISAAALPLPSGAATETTVAAISTKTPALGQAAMAASTPVVIASNQSAVPVSGTFFQATQPVSIASMPSTPVTGTFFQATQPVSIAATLATRDLKDNARTQFSAATVIGGVTAVTSEALLTMVPVRAGVASGTVTTQTVTSGKTLRVTAITVSAKSTSAAVIAGVFALRMNPNGAVTASSPIIAVLSVTQQAAALAQAGDSQTLPLPDGIEFSGTQQFGLTQVCSATTGVVYASIIGFEY